MAVEMEVAVALEEGDLVEDGHQLLNPSDVVALEEGDLVESDSFAVAPAVALDQLAWEVALALELCWSEEGEVDQLAWEVALALELCWSEEGDASTPATGDQHLDQPTTKLGMPTMKPAATAVLVHQATTKPQVSLSTQHKATATILHQSSSPLSHHPCSDPAQSVRN